MPTMIHVTYADGSVGKFGPIKADGADETIALLAVAAASGERAHGAVAVEEEVGTPFASAATAIEERASDGAAVERHLVLAHIKRAMEFAHGEHEHALGRILRILYNEIENGEHTLQRTEPTATPETRSVEVEKPGGYPIPQRISARLLAHELRARASAEAKRIEPDTTKAFHFWQAASYLEEKEP